MYKYILPYTDPPRVHSPVEENELLVKWQLLDSKDKFVPVAEVVQTGPNSHRTLLSPIGLGKGHYWKILQPSKALITICYWLFELAAMK